MRVLVPIWLVAMLGCGGVTAIPGDAGSADKDSGAVSASDDADAGCPPPDLPKGQCVGCGQGMVYCGM